MSGSDNLRKGMLECMRLAADCMQLARGANNSDLQAHFLRMAETWHALADQALSGDTTARIHREDSGSESAGSETSVGDLSLNSNSFAKA